jgi:hypothetical protein
MQDETTVEAPAKVPWYSLNPKHLRFSKFTQVFLLITLPALLLLKCVTIKPLWCLGWRVPLYGYAQFFPVKDSTGLFHAGGAWTRSKRIRVYAAPTLDYRDVEVTVQGLRMMADELGLDFTVVKDAPADGLADIAACRVIDKAGEPHFDFDHFMALRLAHRGDQYGEMILTDDYFVDPDWAWGLTYFPAGVSVLQSAHAGTELARHEGAHLFGYDKHDDSPWYILGYREDPRPLHRNTLMMLNPTPSDALSPRARDALANFWRGMEDRDHVRYRKPAVDPARML